MYVLSIATKDELLQNTKDAETSRKAWNKVAEIFARLMTQKLQQLENKLLSVSQQDMTISKYFNKVKCLCQEIEKLNYQTPIFET